MALRLATDPRPSPPAVAASMVLHVRVVTGKGGGPENSILRSGRFVDRSRYRVAAAYIHPHDDPGIHALAERAASYGLEFHAVPEHGPIDPSVVRELYGLCRRLHVAVWHAHDYKSDALGLMLRRLWPMKLITTAHGFTRESARTRLYYHLDNLCLPQYDHVLAVSPQLVEHCLRRGVRPERLTYLPNAIDPDELPYRPHRPGARAELGLEPGTPVIGVVGRLSVEKGVDRAIDAMPAVLQRCPAARLCVIGDGPERSALEARATRHGLDPAVRFVGWRQNVADCYPALDLLLLPSHTEGSPNVVLEAMAAGVPVAATDVGGVRELLGQGRCGAILGNDPADWHQSLLPLLQHRSAAQALSRRARRRIEKHYAFDVRCRTEMLAYERLLSLPGHTRTDHLRRAA